MTGKNGHNAGISIDFVCLAQSSQSGKGRGRGWLTSDAVATNHHLGFADLFVADVHYEATRLLDGMQRLLP